MNVQTTRFGVVEVEDDKIISFVSGLLGFSSFRRFILLQPDQDAVFFWLQSVEAPELAFVVTDPSVWAADYEVPIRQDQMRELGIDAIDDAQVLVIVNKRNHTLTCNLQGPLVINTKVMKGQQIVLADRKWSTRHELIELRQPLAAASA